MNEIVLPGSFYLQGMMARIETLSTNLLHLVANV